MMHWCVCSHDDLKAIADICFLHDSYIVWRKIWDEFVQGRDHFWRVQGHSLWTILLWAVRFYLWWLPFYRTSA